jgi:hypothetical protein
MAFAFAEEVSPFSDNFVGASNQSKFKLQTRNTRIVNKFARSRIVCKE